MVKSKQYNNLDEFLVDFFKDQPELLSYYRNIIAFYDGTDPKFLSIDSLNTLVMMMNKNLEYIRKISNKEDANHIIQRVKDGNAILPNAIAQKLGNKVHLNMPLKEISKTSKGQYLLKFQDGSTKEFDKVIFAIPATVFKDIKIAKDVIPTETYNNITSLKYGTNAKIATPITLKTKDVQFIASNTSVTWINKDNKVLINYFGGQNGVFEYAKLDQIFHDNLKYPMLGYKDTKINTDKVVKVSNDVAQLQNFQDTAVAISWINEEYSRGSYSNYGNSRQYKLMHPIITINDFGFRKLFQPINNSVFFCGEHTTILDVVGTLEAAVESGSRIADYIYYLKLPLSKAM